MTKKLENNNKVIGVKQVKKAINSSAVTHVYIADDAEMKVTQDVIMLCEEHEIPIINVESMKDLGIACGIDINAATAALLI